MCNSRLKNQSCYGAGWSPDVWGLMTNVYISYPYVNSNLTVYYYWWSGITFQVDHAAMEQCWCDTNTIPAQYYYLYMSIIVYQYIENGYVLVRFIMPPVTEVKVFIYIIPDTLNQDITYDYYFVASKLKNSSKF